MAGQRRDQQHSGLVPGAVLAEAQQVAERRASDDLFAHRRRRDRRPSLCRSRRAGAVWVRPARLSISQPAAGATAAAPAAATPVHSARPAARPRPRRAQGPSGRSGPGRLDNACARAVSRAARRDAIRIASDPSQPCANVVRAMTRAGSGAWRRRQYARHSAPSCDASARIATRRGRFIVGQTSATSGAGDTESMARKPASKADADHQQPQLFLLVAARLAAVQAGRAGLRDRDAAAGRRRGARRAAAAVPSFLVPCLTHDGIKVWDTLAIAEYLNERAQGGLLPEDRRRARALPLDLRRDAFGLRQSALRPADEPQGAAIPASRSGPAPSPTSTAITAIWRECLAASGGPFLFGDAHHGGRHVRAGVHAVLDLRRRRSMPACAAYRDHILTLPAHARMDQARHRRTGRGRRTRRRVLKPHLFSQLGFRLRDRACGGDALRFDLMRPGGHACNRWRGWPPRGASLGTVARRGRIYFV